MRKSKKAFKVAKFAFSVAIIAVFYLIMIDFIKYPETYLSTWRYQLQLEIENGEPEAIEYYQRNYVENGRELF